MVYKLFLMVSFLQLAIGCQYEAVSRQATLAQAPYIHFLTEGVDKRYVEIQAVGEFPRRPAPIYKEIRVEKSVLVPMRDGVRLSTDIYSPVGVNRPWLPCGGAGYAWAL